MLVLLQALVGDRYGYRPIQSVIPESEFDLIWGEAGSNMSKEKLEILDFWYRKDENSIPPTYILQVLWPIVFIIKLFNLLPKSVCLKSLWSPYE